MAVNVFFSGDEGGSFVFVDADAADISAGALRVYRQGATEMDVQLGAVAAGAWRYYTIESVADTPHVEPEPLEPLEEPA